MPKPSITAVFEHYGAQVIGSNMGGWQKATCALNDHDDLSPSASVNEDECKWRCFSCDKGGDAIDLIRENESAGFADAKRLAENFLGEGDQPVRTERGSTGLLPRATRGQQRGGGFVPPWLRDSTSGA